MKSKIELPKSLDELVALGNDAIKKLWLRYFNDLPKIMRHSAIRILWYKIQCESHKVQIEQKNITRLNRYSTDPDKHIENSFKSKFQIRNGSEIVKTFKGREHKVLVKSSGEFIYNDKSYQTLSAVAKIICGSKVSGNDFFGLNNKTSDIQVNSQQSKGG